ncbi:MAG: sulfotransferase [Planctomycetota bacterium]|nr:sulfotransferase [Planctomycetota bacterium]
MKPNFLVIGAGKSGTTSLCAQLAQHPDVFICEPKEPGFFDVRYHRGWSWYESLFEPGRDCAARGEGTVRYSQVTLYPQVAPLIARDLPDARLIYIVRHPLQRIESAWIERRALGMPDATRDFCETVRRHRGFIDASRYWMQINAYRDRFPDDKILVLFFEDYCENPHAVLRKCFAHLGVDETVPIEDTGPQNVWTGKLVDGPAAETLRRVPGFAWLRDAVPDPVRLAFRRVIKRPLEERPVWEEATRRWAAEQLADDTRRFLEFYGKPADFWTLP